MKKDVISILDIEDQIMGLIEASIKIKQKIKNSERYTPMEGMTLGMLFEKPSTRTRISFEVGATQLGGHAIYLGTNDLQLGRGETIGDTGRVISRYVDIVMYRAYEHSNVVELARSSTVPVINALDNIEHPCQILADFQTIYEKKHRLQGIKLTYVGDGNNVCNSLLLGAACAGMDIVVGTPEIFRPPATIVEKAKFIAGKNGSTVKITSSPQEAVDDADVIYTDTWVSMGDKNADERKKALTPFQVNRELVSLARDDYIFMHCLPAHRGEEVTNEIIDSRRSVVIDEAENRLHAQKALMLYLLGLLKL